MKVEIDTSKFIVGHINKSPFVVAITTRQKVHQSSEQCEQMDLLDSIIRNYRIHSVSKCESPFTKKDLPGHEKKLKILRIIKYIFLSPNLIKLDTIKY